MAREIGSDRGRKILKPASHIANPRSTEVLAISVVRITRGNPPRCPALAALAASGMLMQ